MYILSEGSLRLNKAFLAGLNQLWRFLYFTKVEKLHKRRRIFTFHYIHLIQSVSHCDDVRGPAVESQVVIGQLQAAGVAQRSAAVRQEVRSVFGAQPHLNTQTHRLQLVPFPASHVALH